jgi:hypothetical protein
MRSAGINRFNQYIRSSHKKGLTLIIINQHSLRDKQIIPLIYTLNKPWHLMEAAERKSRLVIGNESALSVEIRPATQYEVKQTILFWLTDMSQRQTDMFQKPCKLLVLRKSSARIADAVIDHFVCAENQNRLHDSRLIGMILQSEQGYVGLKMNTT